MLDLVFDTSILRSDPRRSKADFLALIRLAKSGKIKLHIPYFVKQEFVEHSFSEYYDEHLIAIEKSLSKLKKHLPEEISNRLIDLEKQFSEVKSAIVDYPERDFSEWAQSAGAVIHPIANNHGLEVANAYFGGIPPFREKKKREDFPDAFIWQTIYDLSNVFDKLYAIINDKGLRSACETKENIILFNTLEDFLASDICKSLLIESNLADEVSALLNIIPMLETELKEAVTEQISDIIYGEEVESDWIPEDNHTATCDGIEQIDSIEIDATNPLYYGNGQIVIQFETSVQSRLNYAIFKSDYYLLDDARAERISTSPLNKHYDEAEEVYPLIINGKISLEMPLSILKEKELSDEDRESILDGVVIEVDKIEVSDNAWELWS